MPKTFKFNIMTQISSNLPFERLNAIKMFFEAIIITQKFFLVKCKKLLKTKIPTVSNFCLNFCQISLLILLFSFVKTEVKCVKICS